ncbi:MAG: hypothetical protein ILP02_03745 [Clostridia bacterium]|nr:hypothetical protein [Clostridia bacterium]
MKQIRKFGEAGWLIAMILCSLGVCMSAKSGFGVSMVVAPAYVLSNYLQPILPFFTFGNTDYILQGLLILAVMAVVRKVKLKYPLCFLTCVIYGLMLDGWRLLFGTDIPEALYVRIIYMIAGALVTSLSIALYLRSFMPQQGYELFVYEIATEKRKNMNLVKWVYDAVSLVVAIVMMLLLFGRFDYELVGIGTLILTVINTPLIAICGRLLDKFIDFSPMFPKAAVKVFSYVAPANDAEG